ncbi:MAG TPA: S8 family serine peptidase [Acidimicrobiales bacterium]|nr:S8 family serine peptidase [Acidimicrobiales bacterium]
MATKPVQEQVERILDEETGPTVAVILQAREGDRATKNHATAAAAAVAERRLTVRSREVLPDLTAALSGKNRRPGRTPSITASVMAASGQPATSKAAARSSVQPVLATPPLKAAMARAGEDESASAVTPLLAARSVAAVLRRDEVAALGRDSRSISAVYPNRTLKVPRVIEVDVLPRAVEDVKAAAWGVERIGALAAWGAYGARGRGVKVAVLDTGVDAEHPDLKGKVANWAEFGPDGKKITGSTAHDSDRHGTHVCGTIAGGDASGRWIGVAPDARLAVGLVLDGEKGGSDAQVLAGIDWALDHGAHVISMSLGGIVIGPETPGTYTRAIVESFLRGVPVVAAIGNEGDGTGGSPGNDLFSMAVGATDVDDNVAGFSSGRTQYVTQSDVIRPELLPLPYPKPDLSAPGVAVQSSVPGGQWAAFSGTSMATPHTSGAVALLLSATGNLSGIADDDRVGVILDLFVGGVAERGEAGQDHRYGFGRIDVLRTIGLAKDQGL